MSRPNVLLLVQDQLRHDVVVDAALCHTPTMDRLRREGAWFDRCYTPTGLCSPARSSILTGLYPHGTGVLRNVVGPMAAVHDLPQEVAMVSEMLGADGYRTGFAGKWHLGEQAGLRGFDDNRLYHDFLAEERFRPFWGPFHDAAPTTFYTRTPTGERSMPAYNEAPVDKESTPAWAVQEDIRSLLREYAAGDQPFFLTASFFEPHWPYVLPEPYLHMYDPADIAPWPNFEDDFTGKPSIIQRYMTDIGMPGVGWEVWSRIVAYYLGAVTYTDHLMGLVLDELGALGLDESTLVIATCDHGDMAGSHRMFNKGSYLYEETYRIPMAVRWTGQTTPGLQHDGFSSLIDVTPTILDAARVAPPSARHGRSLLPAATAGTPGRDAIYCEYHGDETGPYTQRMIRSGDWKLIAHLDDPTELYDLATDPAELHNVAHEPRHADVRRKLEDRLADLMVEHDDPLGRWPERLARV